MKKTIKDSKGRPLTLSHSLGRGTFGDVYVAEGVDGREYAAKIALTPEEGRGGDLPQRMVRQQGQILTRFPTNLVPQTFGVVDGGAVPCLLMERLPASMRESLSRDVHFIDLLDSLAAICRGVVIAPGTHDHAWVALELAIARKGHPVGIQLFPGHPGAVVMRGHVHGCSSPIVRRCYYSGGSFTTVIYIVY